MNTNKKMNDLKIGDRVKVITVSTLSPLEIIGMTGTVKDLDEVCAGVEFDDYIGGHSGSWNGKKGTVGISTTNA